MNFLLTCDYICRLVTESTFRQKRQQNSRYYILALLYIRDIVADFNFTWLLNANLVYDKLNF